MSSSSSSATQYLKNRLKLASNTTLLSSASDIDRLVSVSDIDRVKETNYVYI